MRRVLFGGSLAAVGSLAYLANSGRKEEPDFEMPNYPPVSATQKNSSCWRPRETVIEQLQRKGARLDRDGGDSSPPHYDVLVIGGGASGSGVALDAQSRGLHVACIDRGDWGNGTSSRSTKLVHGGLRYLEKAVFGLDRGQFQLVREALHERHAYLRNAPHLTNELPILLPVYSWYNLPLYFVGCVAYDLLSGRERLSGSYFMGKGKTLAAFPMLKADRLKGSVVYYDGQTNDSRMGIALILSALALGADCANYAEAVDLLYDEDTGKVAGAKVRDVISGNEFDVYAKTVLNAAGPGVDAIRTMDDPEAVPMIVPSAGTHVVLPKYFSPDTFGLLDPATSDGRILFFLNWEAGTVCGTTDVELSDVPRLPKPTEEEIMFILDEIKTYLAPEVRLRRGDVKAAWTGIRPLVRDPTRHDSGSQALLRSHIVLQSDKNLVTLAGGKWTTYREMAEEAVDELVRVGNLEPERRCVTSHLKVIGAHGWKDSSFIEAIQRFGFEHDVAVHLSHNYGTDIEAIAACSRGIEGRSWPVLGVKLHPMHPMIEAEVIHACRHEMAVNLEDVIARRIRIAFIDAADAFEMLPRIAAIMGEELHWSKAERARQMREATSFLQTMGLHHASSRSSLNAHQITAIREIFDRIDVDRDGLLNERELLAHMSRESFGDVKESELSELFKKWCDDNGELHFASFMDMMWEALEGNSSSLGAALLELESNKTRKKLERPILVARSGGGV